MSGFARCLAGPRPSGAPAAHRAHQPGAGAVLHCLGAMSKTISSTGIVLCALALLGAGCGGGSTPPKSTTTTHSSTTTTTDTGESTSSKTDQTTIEQADGTQDVETTTTTKKKTPVDPDAEETP